MKSIKHISIVNGIAIASTFFALNVEASQCAFVSFSEANIASNNYIFELLGSNGKAIPQPKKFQKIIKGQYQYTLAPGEHTLIVNQWNKEEFTSHNKNLRRGRILSTPPIPIKKTVNLTVDADQHYVLSLQHDKLGDMLFVKEKSSSSCSDKSAATAKTQNSEQFEAKLPDYLENKMKLVMDNIAKHHQITKSTEDDLNIISRKVNSHFGTIVNEQYALNKNGIQVERVIPFSFADKLKLEEGDLITHFGDEAVDVNVAPKKALFAFLKEQAFGKELKLAVMRNGTQVVLSEKYIPVIIPENSYVLAASTAHGLINEIPLPDQLSLQYDQLLLELSDYFVDQGKSNSNISIGRPNFNLRVNVATIQQAQEVMIAESLKREEENDRAHINKRYRSSGALNGSLKTTK